MTTNPSSFDDRAILELMGHRRLGGRVSEQLIAGAPFVRIDVPAIGEEKAATQFYSPGAVYCITPCAEELARRVAEGSRVRRVERWELQPWRHRVASTKRSNAWSTRATTSAATRMRTMTTPSATTPSGITRASTSHSCRTRATDAKQLLP